MRGQSAGGLALVLAGLACGSAPSGPIDYSGPTAEWPDYAGTKAGLHFSPLTQITPRNVDRLVLAWTHRSGDFLVLAAGGNLLTEPGDALLAFRLKE